MHDGKHFTETGTIGKRAKSKRTSISLALFLGPCAWFYTVRQDWRKLIWGLVLAAGAWGFILMGEFITWMLQLEDPQVVWVTGIIVSAMTLVAIHVWAVADTVRKSDSWYARYTTSGKNGPMKQIALLVLVTPLWLCAADDAEPGLQSQGAARAIVTEKAAVFWFPVENVARRWTWGRSGDNVLEYAWLVRVSLMGKEYEFGYSKFQPPGGAAGTGPLVTLLSRGQINMWDIRDDGNFAYVKGVRMLDAYSQGAGISVRLKDPRFLKAFLQERPESVVLKTDGSMLTKTEQTVQVSYPAQGSQSVPRSDDDPVKPNRSEEVDTTDPQQVAEAVYVALINKEYDTLRSYVVPEDRAGFSKEALESELKKLPPLPRVPIAYVELNGDRGKAKLKNWAFDDGLEIIKKGGRWWIER